MIYIILNLIIAILSICTANTTAKKIHTLIFFYFAIYFLMNKIFSNTMSTFILVTLISVKYLYTLAKASGVSQGIAESFSPLNLLFYTLLAPGFLIVNYYIFDKTKYGYFYILENYNALPWLDTEYIMGAINELPLLLLTLLAIYILILYFSLRILNAKDYYTSKKATSSRVKPIIIAVSIIFIILFGIIFMEVWRLSSAITNSI